MPLPRPLALLALALLALAVGATGAQAAYAPQFTASLDPATPGATPKLSTTITQAADESANRKVVVTLPQGFAAPLSVATRPACTRAQVDARSCPDATRIGTAQATAAVFGLPVVLTGTVAFAGPGAGPGQFVLYVFLDNDQFNQHLSIRGTVGLNSAGSFDTIFDGLPNTTTTRFTLTFDGGSDRGIVVNPSVCGDYVLKGSFTSQAGEQATSSSTVTIAGCPAPAPTLGRVTATRSRLSFKLGEPATLRVLVKGPDSDRRVLRRTITGRAGTNRVRLPAKLKRGRYRISVTATAVGGGTAVTRKATLRVR